MWSKILISYLKKWRNGLGHLKDAKAFIKYSNNMYDIYKNVEN